MLEVIQQNLNQLTKSERKLAKVIQKQAEKVVSMTTATLAQAAQVSEPTVNRFCRKVGCQGFPDFKIQLAQNLAKQQGAPFIHGAIEAEDSPQEYAPKIITYLQKALEQLQQGIHQQPIEQCVNKLAHANNIYFCGLGGSGPVAQDAQHKFFRLDTPVQAFNDPIMLRMAAAASSEKDVFVFISQSGQTKPLIEIAQLAKQTRAQVIAITDPNSSLSQTCELTLAAHSIEDIEQHPPSASRIMHLAIVDILATGVALKRGPEFVEHLQKIKQSLKDTRVNRS